MIAPALEGTVRSADGTSIVGAVVLVEQGGRVQSVTTDPSGAFVLPDVTLPATLDIRAAGFVTTRLVVASSPAAIVLAPSAIRESIVVTAGSPGDVWRRPLTGTTVVTREVLGGLPAVTPDEALRVVSGLSLFRRSSSRSSNPTTHGVTMRGLSASGASRALVLLDGIPLNEGFGGWVTWTRVPALALDRIEIDRGAAGDAFGSDALGGLITLTTRTSGRSEGVAAATAGSQGTGEVDVAGGRSGTRLSSFGAATWFHTDGVVPVAPESRGAVDVPADADWINGLGRVGLSGARQHLTISAWGGRDDRGNGTVQQRNRMSGGTAAIAYDGLAASTTFAARASISPNRFRQTFTSVAPGRASETLISTQGIETSVLRVTAEAGRPFPRGYAAGRFALSRASADFTDARLLATSSQSLRDDSEAVSVQAGVAPFARLTLGSGLRSEWRAAPNGAASRDRASVGHASAAWQADDQVTLRASFATSHRWPTLNELARNFQVGSVLTLANADLKPERARSADVALAFSSGRWHASAAGFWTVVHDAIANVTLPSLAGIVRQRRNAGEAHARGLELDADVRSLRAMTLRGSVLVVDARFRQSIEPALEGNRLPQVPRVAFSGSADVHLPASVQAAIVWRTLGSQFDDDRNVFELARASQLDLRVGGRWRASSWYLAVENALDARIEVGRTPLVTLAPGRAIRVGVQIKID